MQDQLNKAINSATKRGHTNHAMLLLGVLRKFEAGTITAKQAQIEGFKIALARAGRLCQLTTNKLRGSTCQALNFYLKLMRILIDFLPLATAKGVGIIVMSPGKPWVI